jgi:hypothetical protein
MRFSPAVICLFTLTIAFAQEEPSYTQRIADIYAIYSLMLTHPETSHGPDENEVYLIADTTVPGTPKDPCVRPPSGQEGRFAEVMEDFRYRRDTPAQLEPRFQIIKPFRLLNPEEVAQFIRRQFPGGPSASHPKVTDLFRLSDVYFNGDRTLALTAISTYCGDLCALYKWKVFEKSKDGVWEEKRNWVTCLTMS